MSVAEYTLLADATGKTITPTVAGVELDNLTSRRMIDTTEVTFVRMQFGSLDPNVNCEVQASVDSGATWQPLVAKFNKPAVNYGNQCSDWDLVSQELIAFGNVLVRTVLFGTGQSTRITYLSLQFR